jgi:hypothetical protein
MRARQKLAADRLSGFEIQTNAKSFHLWLTLPAHWRSKSFVAAAAKLRPQRPSPSRPAMGAERRQAGAGGADNGSARFRPRPGRDAECRRGRFRFDGMIF